MGKVSVRTQARQQVAARRREQREADRAREAKIDEHLVTLTAVLLQREQLRLQGGQTLKALKELGIGPQVAVERVPGELSAREASRWVAAAQQQQTQQDTQEGPPDVTASGLEAADVVP